MKRELIIAAMLAAPLCTAMSTARAESSQTDMLRDLQQKLEQSLKMTEVLAKRVEQLEAAQRGAPKADVATASQDAKIAEIKEQVVQIASGLGKRGGSEGLPLHGFFDVGAATSNRDYPKGFKIGGLSIYMTPQFTDRIKGLAELNFEVGRDGAIGTDLERLQLGYGFNDQLTAWLGRFHTPYGYWNTAFHHGAQIQTSITRPTFLDFEDAGGILPAHTVGAWLTGAVKSGDGKWSYDAYAGNSPRISLGEAATGSLNPNLASSTNKKYMVGANLGYGFGGALEGLKLGLHTFAGDVSDDAAISKTSATRMFGGYAVYLHNDWEILSEYYRFRNRNVNAANDTHTSWAAYAQIGKSFDLWTLFGRLEHTRLDQADLYFAKQDSGQSYRKSVIGVRYDLDPKSALKLEFDRTSLTDRIEDRSNELWLQYAVRF